MMVRVILGVVLGAACQGKSSTSPDAPPARPPVKKVDPVAKFSERHGKLWVDTPEAVVAMKDGGFTIVGESEKVDDSKPRDWDVWVVRVDAAGKDVWSEAVGTDGKSERGMAVVESPWGGVIVAGYTDGKGAGKKDAWVFELDAQGKLVWEKTLGGPENDGARDLVLDADGNIIVAGDLSGEQRRDVAIWKLSPGGEVIWTQRYGGADIDFSDAIVALPDGGFVVAGTTRSKGAGTEDGWLLRLDASGKLVWDRTYGGAELDWFNDVVVLPDGGFAAAGVSSTKGRDGWLVITDGAGNVKSEHVHGGAKGKDIIRALARAADGTFALVGWSDESGLREGWAFTVDASGAKLAEKRFDNMKRELVDVIAVDGGWVMAGDWASTNSNYGNFWLLKTDGKLE